MMATAGPKHVMCFMYFYIKQVTLDRTIIYFMTRFCLYVQRFSSILSINWPEVQCEFSEIPTIGSKSVRKGLVFFFSA
jgi:hypothetical protein